MGILPHIGLVTIMDDPPVQLNHYLQLKKGEKIKFRQRNIQSYHDGTSSWKNTSQVVKLCWDAMILRLRFAMLLRKMLEPASRALRRAPKLDEDGDQASCWDIVESLCKRTMNTTGECCMYIALQDATNNMVTVRFCESNSFSDFTKNSSLTAVLKLQFPTCQIFFDSIVDGTAIKKQAKSIMRQEIWSTRLVAVDTVEVESTTEQEKNGKRALVIVGKDEGGKRKKKSSIDALSFLHNVLLQKGANFLIMVYVEMDVEEADFFYLSSAGVDLPLELRSQALHALKSNCTGRGNVMFHM